MDNNPHLISDKEALRFHHGGRPGKLEIVPTKPMATQRDLSLAYSPGVAVPVRAIAQDGACAYDYTNKGNLVAVISNGSAILGLGNLGALASKPVMEGKAVLFKRFAGLDAIDIEVETQDVDEFVACVRYLGASFGGINLEDIKAPECFMIEARLRELMEIPVFHDDQHGTAIIVAAGLMNALHLTGREIASARLVVNGAGAAAIACVELIQAMGAPGENIIVCDRKGPIYKGRAGLNQWKSACARDTKARSLAEAMEGADIALGLSAAGAFTPDMIASMGDKPVIFALANPDPEIAPEDARAARPDAIIATGRSDYPNQVNNVLGFPYIFRGALDVRARTINMEMKIACARALADLARADVPDEVAAAYDGERPRFGPNYIIPAPFDPRLIDAVPPAVAEAAMETGVARLPIADMEAYRARLRAMQNPVAATFQKIMAQVRRAPKRVVFAEGEEEQVIRAALTFHELELGDPVLIGRRDEILQRMEDAGLDGADRLLIEDPLTAPRAQDYTEFLYARLQRRGFLQRDCARMVRTDRNIFSACKLAMGDADALLTGVTRNYSVALDDICTVIDPCEGRRRIGVSMILTHDGRTVFVADTDVHEMPNAEELADIATEAARVARRLDYEPRVAFLAYSTFGNPENERALYAREAVRLLDARGVDFEYEGEMAADIALNTDAQGAYPFSRLTGPANVLVMPAIHSASISTKMLQQLGKSTVIGPMLVGLQKPVQIMRIGCSVSDLVNMATIAAYDLDR